MNNNGKGFTLVELVVVIIILSVMAITVVPNLSGNRGFSETAERDQVLSLFRTVQTRAMQNTQFTNTPGSTQKRCYAVAFVGQDIGMRAQDGNGDCTSNFVANVGDVDDHLRLELENSYTTNQTFVRFDDFGRPLNAAGNGTGQVRVTIANAESVCVESEGYVHVCQ